MNLRRLEVGKLYLRKCLRAELKAENEGRAAVVAEILALVELATRAPEPARPTLVRDFGRTQFAGRAVRGDTVPATLVVPL